MIDDGVVARYDFGDRVGEIGAAVTGVSFDDGGVAMGFRYDQDAGVGYRGMAVGG
jgi:hypothetical protein